MRHRVAGIINLLLWPLIVANFFTDAVLIPLVVGLMVFGLVVGYTTYKDTRELKRLAEEMKQTAMVRAVHCGEIDPDDLTPEQNEHVAVAMARLKLNQPDD
jgi:hypothetical protein